MKVRRKYLRFLLFVGGVAALFILFYTFEDSPPENIVLENISLEKTPEALKITDSFNNTDKYHWSHMPLSFMIEEGCSERQNNLTLLAFQKIEEETGGIVSFVRTEDKTADITVNCEREASYGRINEDETTIAVSLMETIPDTKIISKGTITIYGQGQICATGYPATEAHEILHLFDIGHNPLTKSIMHPYAAESSNKCKTTQVDKEYISCLRNIYSRGLIPGECVYSSYLEEVGNEYLECPEGWFDVVGSEGCCPEPGMHVAGEYCVY